MFLVGTSGRQYRGGSTRPWPRYGRAAPAGWVRRLAEAFGDGVPAYVYVNDDPGGAAIVDAVAVAGPAGRAGLPVSRTPAARPAEGAGRAGPVPDQGII
ncbi:hypothetical protein [Micromonospora aurantiaca (nom. illeg.)]|uniref:hypothetical protein n=1 Tax=Micromonospora aurantiaca (nom. illeg.) TaxID=47850 RepID=UPI0033D19D70